MTATVTVIGLDGPELPPDAVSMVATARRTIELTGSSDVSQSTLDELAKAVDADEPAVVLTRGDPGYFGVLRALRARGLPTVSRPSVSSLQRVAAMIQRPWDDVSVVSVRARAGRARRRAGGLAAHPCRGG